VHKMKRMWRTH